MIEDARYLTVLHGHNQEIVNLVAHYNSRMSGLTDKGELIALRRKMLTDLEEMLFQQQRALDHMEGRPVEPQMHFAEGVLVGEGGGSGS